MAGGKLSARQKMINLMYLVFIAMIAMTMTKEVLSAFGSMDEKFVDSNNLTSEANISLLENLSQKAEDNPDEFADDSKKAKEIQNISNNFYNYIETLKRDLVKGGGYELEENGKLPYEKMDQGDYLDEKWFTGDRLSKEGQVVFDRINQYKSEIISALGEDEKFKPVIESFDKRFYLGKVKPLEGDSLSYLDYNYKGFPAIASHAKLTAMQNDVKTSESNIYSALLGNKVDKLSSITSYKAIVIADKSAYFSGQQFSGRVVIGKYSTVEPSNLTLNGRDIDLSNPDNFAEDGAPKIKFTVGNIGEQTFKGEFTFNENGEEIPIPYEGNYVVVPKPNSATISADKMNVVYRGVDNPMTISFAGVPDNKVNASAPGLTKVGNGKYVMRPQSGREVTISVNGTLDDNSPVSDRKLFRIKDLPKPYGYFNGQLGSAKLPKSNVEIGKLSANFGDDFDFALPLTVQSFKIKVPGKATVTVSGNRLNAAAKTAVRSARRGDVVQFFDIKARANSNIKIKTVTPVGIEISN